MEAGIPELEIPQDEDNQGAEGASNADDNERGDPLLQLQSQIQELGERHDQMLSALASLNTVNTRSYVYIPREKQIVPYCGDSSKDSQTVDEFIDELERVIRVRGLGQEDQVDFILSHLRGSALDEVKLCLGGKAAKAQDLFVCLVAAFGEKRTIPQLLHAFYARKQLEGEDLREYSHALSTMLNAVQQQSSAAVPDVQVALRDQFIEGVRDVILRRELRKLVREKPYATLFEVREEALMWCVEERPRGASVARNRYLMGHGIEGGGGLASGAAVPSNDLNAVLQEVVKVVAHQGKAIGDLTDAVRGLMTQRSNPGFEKPQKPKFKPRYTQDGQPICMRCEGVGHIARQCTTRRDQHGAVEASTDAHVQGNAIPPLL